MSSKVIKLALLNLPGWDSSLVKQCFKQCTVEDLTDPESMFQFIEAQASEIRRINLPDLSEIKKAFDIAHQIQEFCLNNHIQILTEENTNYPNRIRKLPQRPVLLYAKGNSAILNDEKVVALIGAKAANDSVYKKMQAIGSRCAANNVRVLSGLDLGCNTAAHQGCVDGGGKTIAVLGSGLDKVSPVANKKLAAAILDNGGCLVSECEPQQPARKVYLLARDKLQSGFSDSVIVGQTKIHGEAMQAANYMVQIRRPLAALSGGDYQGDLFSGNVRLIRQGAKALNDDLAIQRFIGIA